MLNGDVSDKGLDHHQLDAVNENIIFLHLTVPGRGIYAGSISLPVSGSIDFETLKTAKDIAQPIYIAASAK
jgi:hypothetical protein